jgi:predicted ArsR family transcriptional regulator
MKPTKPDPDLAKWCAALAFQDVCDVVPPGWKTAVEIAKMLGLHSSTAQRHIRAALAEGRFECQKFRVKVGQRSSYPVPHYRLTT